MEHVRLGELDVPDAATSQRCAKPVEHRRRKVEGIERVEADAALLGGIP